MSCEIFINNLFTEIVVIHMCNKREIFVHENNHHTIPYKNNYFFFDIKFLYYNNNKILNNKYNDKEYNIYE